jgi:hypothetical protein
MRTSRLVGIAIAAAVICLGLLTASGHPQDFCFNAAVNYAAGDYPYSVFAADLDGDGDLDLAAANPESANVSVLKNNGDGTFAAAVNYAVENGDGPISVFAADLDGDNDADLAVANAYGDNVSVFINCTCNCPHQGDIAARPTGDGVIDVFDVIEVIGIAFSGSPDIQDPQCPKTRGDVDNNGVTDVFDVIYLIATAFSGGAMPVDPCGP